MGAGRKRCTNSGGEVACSSGPIVNPLPAELGSTDLKDERGKVGVSINDCIDVLVTCMQTINTMDHRHYTKYSIEFT